MVGAEEVESVFKCVELFIVRTVGLLVVLVRDVDGESAAYPMWQYVVFEWSEMS